MKLAKLAAGILFAAILLLLARWGLSQHTSTARKERMMTDKNAAKRLEKATFGAG